MTTVHLLLTLLLLLTLNSWSIDFTLDSSTNQCWNIHQTSSWVHSWRCYWRLCTRIEENRCMDQNRPVWIGMKPCMNALYLITNLTRSLFLLTRKMWQHTLVSMWSELLRMAFRLTQPHLIQQIIDFIKLSNSCLHDTSAEPCKPLTRDSDG
jgi:hypothetical protein